MRDHRNRRSWCQLGRCSLRESCPLLERCRRPEKLFKTFFYWFFQDISTLHSASKIIFRSGPLKSLHQHKLCICNTGISIRKSAVPCLYSDITSWKSRKCSLTLITLAVISSEDRSVQIFQYHCWRKRYTPLQRIQRNKSNPTPTLTFLASPTSWSCTVMLKGEFWMWTPIFLTETMCWPASRGVKLMPMLPEGRRLRKQGSSRPDGAWKWGLGMDYNGVDFCLETALREDSLKKRPKIIQIYS